MNRELYYSYLLMCIACCFHSCKKFVDIPPAPDLIATASIFQDQKTALAAVSGVYIQLRNSSGHFSNGGMSVYGGLCADELNTTVSNAMYDPFLQNALLPGNTVISTNFWGIAYKNIYRTNAIIDGLSQSKSIPLAVKNQLTGEMKLVRAFSYFYLVNLFGAVPLAVTPDYEVNASLSRTDTVKVYDQMVSDLKDAITLMTEAYPSSGKSRPNKWAAAALLSRVYLYRQDWDNAAKSAGSVIGSGIYQLKTNLNEVFIKESQETIWELASSGDASNTDQGLLFIPSSSTVRPSIVLNPSLLSAFETGDKRLQQWVLTTTIAGQSYPYPAKYRERAATSPVKEYNVVFRLAEQFLIRAEARTQTGDYTGAVQDLNTIRSRAGLQPNIAADKNSLLAAIEKERQTELFTEWGDRWLNLKRTMHLNTILGAIKGANWKPTAALFPLPQTELDYNPALVQNAGY